MGTERFKRNRRGVENQRRGRNVRKKYKRKRGIKNIWSEAEKYTHQ